MDCYDQLSKLMQHMCAMCYLMSRALILLEMVLEIRINITRYLGFILMVIFFFHKVVYYLSLCGISLMLSYNTRNSHIQEI